MQHYWLLAGDRLRMELKGHLSGVAFWPRGGVEGSFEICPTPAYRQRSGEAKWLLVS